MRILVTAAHDPTIELDDAKRKAGLFERAFSTQLSLSWPRATRRSWPAKAFTERRVKPRLR